MLLQQPFEFRGIAENPGTYSFDLKLLVIDCREAWNLCYGINCPHPQAALRRL
jgi:hypothetical protein